MIEQTSLPIRVTKCNEAPVRSDGDFVLYWMIAFRRTEWNHSLDRAIAWAIELKRPLVIFEPLRIGYRWASDRIHGFVIDGMADNGARIARRHDRGVLYYPYAIELMIELNNRFGVDGRDPNSYSGIFWCLGRYDRPWGPERPILGTVRYMSPENTQRKLRVKEYLRTYG
jgi:hypothetical protein